jgi:peptide deformylase
MGEPFTLQCEGWLARCICHELDHLDGVLFIDKTLDKEKYLKNGGKI